MTALGYELAAMGRRDADGAACRWRCVEIHVTWRASDDVGRPIVRHFSKSNRAPLSRPARPDARGDDSAAARPARSRRSPGPRTAQPEGHVSEPPDERGGTR